MLRKTEPHQDFVLVNENKIRVTSLIILILTTLYFFTGSWLIPAFLVFDFFLRCFGWSNYSILNILSINLVIFFSLEVKPVNKAPRRLEAKIGLFFAVIIIAADLLDFTTAAKVFATILALFAFLESVVGYCISCDLYNWYKNLFKKNNNPISDQVSSEF
jgi:Domain of unknown function (DUF4395)